MGLICKLKVAQRAMERAMLGVSLQYHVRNYVIPSKLKSPTQHKDSSDSSGSRRGSSLAELMADDDDTEVYYN